MAIKIKLNRRSKVDLSKQIYESLKQLILEGALGAGERMPSSRELSAQLQVSRPTVAVCLEQLQQEGFIELKHGSGTYVSSQVSAGDKRASERAKTAIALSSYAKFIDAELQRNSRTSDKNQKLPEISFSYWRPALDEFPNEQWARILGRYARDSVNDLHDSSLDYRGELPLRKAIAELVLRFRGVKCSADQVIIVNGLTGAIDLVARLHLECGDVAVVEEPGYHQARLAFRALGAKILATPVDENGLKIEGFTKSKTAPKLVYATPSHQFPTGETMSLQRRLELLKWAQKNKTIILEDDYDSEYQKIGQPIPALMSLDRGESVIYAGTLNQLMFPALGLAYLVVPPILVPLYKEARAYAGTQMPPHLQKAIAQFIDEGHLDRHIKRLRALYDERRQTLLEEFEKRIPDRITISGADSGVFVLARLKTRLSPEDLRGQAREKGLELLDTSAFYTGKVQKNEYIFGFGNLTKSQIKEGVKRLAAILNGDGAKLQKKSRH